MNKLKLLPFLLILVLALCLALSACGGGDAAPQDGEAEEDGLVRPAYRAGILNAPGDLGQPRRLAAAGDSLYVQGSRGLFVTDREGADWRQIEPEGVEEDISALAASEDRLFLLCPVYEMGAETMTQHLSVYACDPADGSLLATWPLEGFDDVFTVHCLTAEGKLILAADRGETVRVYAPDGELLRQVAASGSVLFLAKTPDSLLVCAENAGGGKTLSRLDAEAGTLSELCPIDSDETPSFSYVSDSGTYWASEGGLYSLSAGAASSEKLFSWADLGIGTPTSGSFYCDGTGTVFLAGNLAGCIYQISAYDGPPLKELVVGAASIGTWLTKAISIFNSESTEYTIRLERYDTETIDQVLTEINAGRGPDILALGSTTDGQNPLANVSVRTGLLEDLLPYLDADSSISREDFLPGVLESMTERGGLYRLTPAFSLNTLVGPQELAEGWNMEALTGLAGQLPEGVTLFDTYSRDFFMQVLCQFASVAYLDAEEGVCGFDDGSFAQWLELVRELPFQDTAGNGGCALHAGSTHPCYNVPGFADQFGDYAYLGFPDREGACSYLTSGTGGFSILTSSPNKQAAWDFLRLLLTPQIQEALYAPGFGLPVMEADFDAAMEDYMQREDSKLTQADVDRFKAVVAANAGMAKGSLVSDMIREEAEKTFTGQKSLEDSVEMLQSKARLYLAEQG